MYENVTITHLSLISYLLFAFTVVHGVDHEKEEEKLETSRLNEFGDWLDQDQEELPEEFRLNVER